MNRLLTKDVHLHLLTFRYPLLMVCVKHRVNGSKSTPYRHDASSGIPDMDKRWYALKDEQMPPTRSMYEMLAGSSNTTRRISAQCVQPFPRYRKEMRTYAHADIGIPIRCLCNIHSCWAPPPTYQISAQSVQSFPKYGKAFWRPSRGTRYLSG